MLKINEIFITFIKYEGLYVQFIRNGNAMHQNKMDYYKNVKSSSFIINSFFWATTEEGMVKWEKLHDKWNTLLREINKILGGKTNVMNRKITDNSKIPITKKCVMEILLKLNNH